MDLDGRSNKTMSKRHFNKEIKYFQENRKKNNGLMLEFFKVIQS